MSHKGLHRRLNVSTFFDSPSGPSDIRQRREIPRAPHPAHGPGIKVGVIAGVADLVHRVIASWRWRLGALTSALSGLQEHGITVVVEKMALPFAETSYIQWLCCRHSHPLKGRHIRYRRQHQPTRIFERDKAAIE